MATVSSTELVTRLNILRRKISWLLLAAIPALVLVVLWEIGARYLFDPQFVGQPSLIAIGLYQQALSAPIWIHTWITVEETVLGFVLGVITGAAAGYFLGFNQKWAAIFEPYLLALNAVPKVAIAPLLIVTMGIGIGSKIAIAATMVFFLMFYSVFVGIKLIDIDFIFQAKLMGADERTVIRHVIVPSIMPNLLAGMKTSIVYAMIGAVIGELIAARSGLGYFILEATGVFNVTNIWVGVVFLMIMVLIMSGFITYAERRLLRWLPPTKIKN